MSDSFKKLKQIDVKPYVKEKNKLSYLSWAIAWRLVIEVCPDATYELKTFDDGMPCKITPFGAFVSTSVTIDGITREMTLPVLDGANKSLKAEAYTYTTKFGEKSVDALNAFDINKAQMRCLVKNLGVFGLGLDLYIGYDLPEDLRIDEKIDNIKVINDLVKETKSDLVGLLAHYKVQSVSKMSIEQQENAIYMLEKKKPKEVKNETV